MKSMKGKIVPYLIVLLIGAVVISSSVSAFELTKSFVEEKNILKPIEKQSTVNSGQTYSSTGPGIIILCGYGWLSCASGDYNLSGTGGGIPAGILFVGALPILIAGSTYICTSGTFNPAGLTALSMCVVGANNYCYVVGFVNGLFTITGWIYP